MTQTATLSRLFIYPLKSGAGIEVNTAILTTFGLKGDRKWLVVDEDGTFVTQRQITKLALLHASRSPTADASEDGGDITLTCAGQSLPLSIAAIERQNQTRSVRVWSDTVSAYDCGPEAAEFLRKTIGDHRGRPLRLMLRHEGRPVADKYTNGADSAVHFADGFPFLVANEASLDDLQSRINARHEDKQNHQIEMERFRPNLVLRGLPAYAEDEIDYIETAQGAKVRVVKPCARCVITMVDRQTTKKGVEPLETLRLYRNDILGGKGIMFGQNALLDSGASLSVRAGETVKVFFK